MNNAVIYIHGSGGNAAEAEHYKCFFPDDDVMGFDYRAETPWEAKDEFPGYFDKVSKNHASVILIANSIGAYFTMSADVGQKVAKAYFISPIVDMEKLITDMMMWAHVNADELHEKGEIETPFGQTLSWAYLSYVKKQQINWTVPTHILYGGKDNLTSFETMMEFAEQTGAILTVMEKGEHWFHTEEQMELLDNWMESCK